MYSLTIKTQALSRLLVVSNTTVESYLVKMGRMYKGLTPMSSDCRSTVVRAIKADPEANRQIYIVGLGDTPVHTFTVDAHGRPLADSWHGCLDSHTGIYHKVLPAGAEELEVIKAIDVSHFLSTYANR